MNHFSSLRPKLPFSKLLLVASVALLCAACSDDSDLEEKQALYGAYSIEDIRGFIDAGELQKAADTLHFFRDQDTATDAHLILLAEVYVGLGDGIAAETLIDRLRSRGVTDDKTALSLAQAFMLQNRFDEAEETLRETDLPAVDMFEGLLLRGDIARSIGDYDKAERLYVEAIAADPEDFRGYTAAALLSFQQGNLEKAAEYADLASARTEDDSIVSYIKGMVARYGNDLESAKTHFLRAIELNDTNLLSRIEIVAIYLAQGDIEAAEEQIDFIYAASPNNPMANYYVALMLVTDGKFDEAEDILLRTGDFTESYPPAAQVYGLINYQLKKYSTGIVYLTRALNFYPNDLSVRLALAESLTVNGQNAQALKVLAPVIEEGNNVQGLTYAAVAATGQSDIGSARKYLEQALSSALADDQTDPADIKELQRKLASARYLDGDLKAATELLEDSESTDDISSLIMKANMLINAGDFAGAEQAIATIRIQAPNDVVADNLMGTVRYRQRRYDDAIEVYSKALEKKPDYQSAIKNRALTYITVRDFPKARADLEKIIEAAPNDSQLLAMYGRALLETDDAEQALPYLEQASTLMPNTAIVAADYAEALAENGYYSSALTQARKARTLAPNNEDFVNYLKEQTVLWEKARVESEATAKLERSEQQAKIEEERAKEKALQKALIADSAVNDGGEDQSAKALAELRALAEANRKADEEERLKEQARLAEEARLKAEDDAANPDASAADAAADALKKKRAEAERMRIYERNRLFGAWLASELELSESEAESYIKSVIAADESEPGDTDIVRKGLLDLEKAGKGKTIQAIQKKLSEFDLQSQTEGAGE